MSDSERGMIDEPEEDRLPWLEPVEEQPLDEGVSAGRLIAGLLVALIALGLVVGGVYWLKQRASAPQVASADSSDTIAAPPAPYKVKPSEPGGLQVKGQGDSAYAASEGSEVNGQIDLTATPEAPVTKAKPVPVAVPTAPPPVEVAKASPPLAVPPAKPVAKPVEVAKATPAPKPVAPVTKPIQVAKAPAPKPATTPKPVAAPAEVATESETPVAGGHGTLIQLGAFATEGKANAAWKSLSGRVSALSGLSPTVTSAQVGGRTVYRLRSVAGGKASQVCAKLKVAGETCIVVS